MRGYAWGAASVLLVTLAQLLMKWGMVQIPLMSFADVSLALIGDYWLPLLAVGGGIFGYALSMLCWFFCAAPPAVKPRLSSAERQLRAGLSGGGDPAVV